jgi:putative SOS response-associated peptidase YedK
MTTKDKPLTVQIVLRLNALKRAEKAAKNPEFRELWKAKRIALLAAGNSYDDLTGELI